MKKNLWIISIIVLLVMVAAFFGYTMRYYHATDTAAAALESDDVIVAQTVFGWRFDGPADDKALVFYPGGKVDETAYAPLLHRIAKNGMDVFLVKMPLHLAIFGKNSAENIISQYDYKNWYIGGHSLGGVMAVYYAADHDLDGVILLAAYPTKAIDEPMLILYGSEDGVLDLDRVKEAQQFGTVEEVVIAGGNHAGFGNYGEQNGDRVSAISEEKQQEETADAISSWLLGSCPENAARVSDNSGGDRFSPAD